MSTPPSLPAISTPCTGCGLCAATCPHGCITMQESDEGFFIPVVKLETCRQCGACQRACAKQEQLTPADHPKTYYEAYIKDSHERRKVSSGGVCTALARKTIQNGGFVYGVALMPDFRARYIEATTEQDIAQLRGSKYVQADTSGCFQKIAIRLKEKKQVLFIGTACQVRALRVRFGFQNPLLTAVDIACYGVPSYHLLDAYIRELNSGTDQLSFISFKNKHYGWRNNSILIRYKSGKEILSPASSNPFIQGFDTRLCLNKACYSCQRNPNQRFSDLTCGDFWGHKDSPGDDSDLGISSIVCHSTRGEQILNSISDTTTYTPVNAQPVTKNNGGLTTTLSTLPSERASILRQLKHENITKVVRKYVYSQGGKKIIFYLFGIRLPLPECIYNNLRTFVRRWLRR